LLSTEPRSATAKALTYCEFQVIEARGTGTPDRQVFAHCSLYVANPDRAWSRRKDELVARHAMGFSVVVAYAQLLELIAAPQVASEQTET
jgi:hypothetical protein